MPLSPPLARELLHLRDIALRGYLRADGLCDIEAHLTDTKTQGFTSEERGYVAVGEPLHSMWMRMTVDQDLTVITCEAVTEYSPYPQVCPQAAVNFSRLEGLSIKRGFVKAAMERVGGTAGCTHLRELLQQMATVAFQTLYSVLMRREMAGAADAGESAGATAEERVTARAGGRPMLLNTCLAWGSDSPVIKRRWPQLYTGPDTGPNTGRKP